MPGRRSARQPFRASVSEYHRRAWRGGLDGSSPVPFPVQRGEFIYQLKEPEPPVLEEPTEERVIHELSYSGLTTYGPDVYDRYSTIVPSGSGDATSALRDGTQPGYVRLHSVRDLPGFLGPGAISPTLLGYDGSSDIAASAVTRGGQLSFTCLVYFNPGYALENFNYAKGEPEYLSTIVEISFYDSSNNVIGVAQVPASTIPAASYGQWVSYNGAMGFTSSVDALLAEIAAGSANLYVLAAGPSTLPDPWPDGPETNAEFEIWIDELRLYYSYTVQSGA